MDALFGIATRYRQRLNAITLPLSNIRPYVRTTAVAERPNWFFLS